VREEPAEEDGLVFVGWSAWRKQGETALVPGTVVVRGAPEDHGERLSKLLKGSGSRSGSSD
jgi:hypothetical protein